jgi:endoglucanase
MEEKSYQFLKDILNAISPSGFEDEAAHIWKEYAKEFAHSVITDLHGNSIAVLNENGKPRVMLAGHIDEIGFMVKYIDDDGFIYFTPIGGWDLQIPQGQRVWIKTNGGRITGVIGKKPIHLLDEEERKKIPKFKDLWIDIGAKNRREAEEIVKIGDPIVLAYEFTPLKGDLVAARGIDDRVGAFVVLEALRLLSREKINAAVFSVATVQEEIDLRGAKTSAFRISPEIGIAVDVTFATDFPKIRKEKEAIGDIKLGMGPVIARGPNINPKVFDTLLKVAEEEDIPYQVEGLPRGTGTDANVIQLTREGVATGLISIPNRYMHTPCEVISVKDLENAAKLIAAFVKRLDEGIDFTPH